MATDIKRLGFRMPLSRAMLDDPAMRKHVLDRLLLGVDLQIAEVAEGRTPQIDRIEITIAQEPRRDTIFPKDLWIAQISVAVALIDS